jgi:hypothetical protein
MDENELSLFVPGAYDVFKTFCRIHKQNAPFNQVNREYVVLVMNQKTVDFFGDELPDEYSIMAFPSHVDPEHFFCIASAQMLRLLADGTHVENPDMAVLDKCLDNVSDSDFVLCHIRAGKMKETGISAGVFDCNKLGLI